MIIYTEYYCIIIINTCVDRRYIYILLQYASGSLINDNKVAMYIKI